MKSKAEEPLELLNKVIDAIEAADGIAEAADGPVLHVRDVLTDDDWRVLYRRLVKARDALALQEPPSRDTEIERCPVCGSPVEIVSSDEGTSHYRPLFRSQPASEPSLAVTVLERLANASRDFTIAKYRHVYGTGGGTTDEQMDTRTTELLDATAAAFTELARLSQPADNEAAE